MSNYQTSVTTNKVRLSYVNVFKPREDKNGRLKYSVTLLIPKSDTETLQRINAAIQSAAQKGLDGAWGGAMPPQLPTPIHDGDGVRDSGEPYGPECKGHWVITASSNENHPPEVVDGQLNKILDQSAVYSGCFARVNINFFPSGGGTTGFKKGVGCGLGPIQKVADGDALGGTAPSASSVFDQVPYAEATGAGVPFNIMENPFPEQPQPQQQNPGTVAINPSINPITGLPM